jgi:hypothetical protein
MDKTRKYIYGNLSLFSGERQTKKKREKKNAERGRRDRDPPNGAKVQIFSFIYFLFALLDVIYYPSTLKRDMYPHSFERMQVTLEDDSPPPLHLLFYFPKRPKTQNVGRGGKMGKR